MVEIPRLSDEVRASLPAEAQAYIAALETAVSTLQAEVQSLHGQIAELVARVQQTSQNSSRPPSSDPPDVPLRPQHPPSSRQRGGQPGHPRHERKLLPASEVDAVIEHRPTACPSCQADLASDLPDAAEPERQQIWELPEVKPQVTEHRYHQVVCPHCGTLVEAERPAGVPAGAFGARVVALVGLLHGRYRLGAVAVISHSRSSITAPHVRP